MKTLYQAKVRSLCSEQLLGPQTLDQGLCPWTPRGPTPRPSGAPPLKPLISPKLEVIRIGTECCYVACVTRHGRHRQWLLWESSDVGLCCCPCCYYAHVPFVLPVKQHGLYKANTHTQRLAVVHVLLSHCPLSHCGNSSLDTVCIVNVTRLVTVDCCQCLHCSSSY